MIKIPNPVTFLESWRGLAAQSIAIAACAAAAFFWDGDAASAAMLLTFSFVLGSLAIPFYRYDKKHHSG